MASWTDLTDKIQESEKASADIPTPNPPLQNAFRKEHLHSLKTAYFAGVMSEKHECLLDVGQLEANASTSRWMPAAGIRMGTRRAVHTVAIIIRRCAAPFWLKSANPPEKPRRTAYLDGLRGFAAFLVYWHHHELWVHKATGQNELLENSFGYNGNFHLVAFPGVRILFNGGHYAVATFFVISGYVLSAKPLSLIHEGELTKLGDNVASALFRRWLRLWIPLMAVTLVYVSSWHLLGMWVEDASPKSTWLAEVWSWYTEMKNFNFVFSGGEPWLSYDMHLWSIPVEMKGSIVVYTTLVALSRVSRNARLWCELTLIFYFSYIADGWYCAMFVSGMLLSDLDLLAAKQQLPRWISRLSSARAFVFYHLLAFSLYLGGVPESGSRDVAQLGKQRGWYYLSLLKPQAFFDYKWFYLLWAATFLVASSQHIKWLKGFFEARFCQYLGRISYALYLVHGPVLWTLGDRIYTAVGWHSEQQLQNLSHWADKFALSKTGPLGLEISFILPHIILLPATIWLADIVTRLIDEPSVRFAQWLYSRMLPHAVKD
ncbi:hypothetical protein JX266_010690 [Neoarthrinium moseri]|nr:hypothetical protein JX266_010690 [Neoarthrinium moseri]